MEVEITVTAEPQKRGRDFFLSLFLMSIIFLQIRPFGTFFGLFASIFFLFTLAVYPSLLPLQKQSEAAIGGEKNKALF